MELLPEARIQPGGDDVTHQIEEYDQASGDVIGFKEIDYTHITELSNMLAQRIEEYMDKRLKYELYGHLYHAHGYDMTEIGTSSSQIRT